MDDSVRAMDDPWETLASAASEVLNFLWHEFAKEGRENAVLAPLRQYPKAAAWLAGCMGLSADMTTRKMGAVLAGWIDDPRQVGVLIEMLDRERKLFPEDHLTANSVGEDIMFAATRWTESRNPLVKNAGIEILASMTRDVLSGTPWNDASWAVANLFRATGGKHDVFLELASATDAQMQGQQFFRRAVMALRSNDMEVIKGYATPPSPQCALSPDDIHYPEVSVLWNAAASAEASLG